MDVQQEIQKAEVLIEAIPYIRRFAGTVVVIKYGGSAAVDEKLRKSVIQDSLIEIHRFDAGSRARRRQRNHQSA